METKQTRMDLDEVYEHLTALCSYQDRVKGHDDQAVLFKEFENLHTDIDRLEATVVDLLEASKAALHCTRQEDCNGAGWYLDNAISKVEGT